MHLIIAKVIVAAHHYADAVMVLAYVKNKICRYVFLGLGEAGVGHKTAPKGEVVVMNTVPFKAVKNFLFFVINFSFRLRCWRLGQQETRQEEDKYGNGCFQERKGLERRSWPMVVAGPCPLYTFTSSPKGKSLVTILLIKVV